MDRKIGLLDGIAAALEDSCAPERITLSLRDLIAQRLYGPCCDYENLNDHDVLRQDPLKQTAVGKMDGLASSLTFSQLVTHAIRATVITPNRVLIE